MTRETVGGLIRWSHPTDENLWPDSTLKRRKPPAEVKVVGKPEIRIVTEPEVPSVEIKIVGRPTVRVIKEPLVEDVMTLFENKEA